MEKFIPYIQEKLKNCKRKFHFWRGLCACKLDQVK